MLCLPESGDSWWLLDSRAYWGCEPWLVCVVSVELDSLEVKDDWDVCEPIDNEEITLSYCNIESKQFAISQE